jgi:crotonobetainyl-CoA:carnitine CoA-transferase CaiB-like acyl-CoA transferase
VGAARIVGGGAVRRVSTGFIATVLHAVSWRAVLVTQCLGFLFSLSSWLEQWQQPDQPLLTLSVAGQAMTALLAMLAALACDEAARRGARVWRAFVVAVLSASCLNVLAQALLAEAFHPAGGPALLTSLDAFLTVGGLWGTFVMVYVNRRSARRLLERIRTSELERVRAEQRVAASRLAAAETQIDPGAVLRQLAQARELYAAACPEADERLEALIARLRDSLRHRSAADSLAGSQ